MMSRMGCCLSKRQRNTEIEPQYTHLSFDANMLVVEVEEEPKEIEPLSI